MKYTVEQLEAMPVGTLLYCEWDDGDGLPYVGGSRIWLRATTDLGWLELSGRYGMVNGESFTSEEVADMGDDFTHVATPQEAQ